MGRSRLSGEFENGDVDRTTFDESFGKPYRIEIHHDGSGVFAGWQLDRVRFLAQVKMACFNVLNVQYVSDKRTGPRVML